MLMELGPCSVKDDPKGVNDTERNPYAWNEKVNQASWKLWNE